VLVELNGLREVRALVKTTALGTSLMEWQMLEQSFMGDYYD